MSAGDVIFRPQRIKSDKDFNAVINQCDIIYCAYRDHLHSSGLVSKAAAMQKPLIVSDGELLAKRVLEYRLGCVLQEQTAEACLAALRVMNTPGYREDFRNNKERTIQRGPFFR